MKTIKHFFLLFFTGLLMVSLGCDNDNDNDPTPSGCIDGIGNVVNQDITLPGDITGFAMTIVADVVLTQGATQEVSISAQQNIIDNIETRVANGNWEIDFEQCANDYEDITIYITLPDLKDIVITGVGSVSATNTFTGLEELNITFTGSGDLTLDVEAQTINSSITGVGDIVLSGTTVDQSITISGVGNYHGFDLISETCTVMVSGAGNAEVSVTDDLNVTISGAGNVYYKGSPDLTVTISGTGNLIDSN